MDPNHLFLLVLTSQILTSSLAELHSSDFLIPSMFPNVPPFISFSSYRDLQPQVISPLISQYLIWGPTDNFSKNVITKIMENTGIHMVQNNSSSVWFGRWNKKSCTSTRNLLNLRKSKSPAILTEPFQKYNHIPGALSVAHKDRQWVNFKKLVSRHGWSDFPFLFQSFILPQEFDEFKKVFQDQSKPSGVWIVKNPKESSLRGIQLITYWKDIDIHRLKNSSTTKTTLVQKYLENPYLWNKKKFQVTLYVVMTSVSPLRIYVSEKNVLIRRHSEDYSNDPKDLQNRCIHFPQYANDKAGNCGEFNYSNFFFDGKSVLENLASKNGVKPELIMGKMNHAIILTFLSVEKYLGKEAKTILYNNYNAYQLFSFDFVLDELLNPFLIETNSNPVILRPNPYPLALGPPMVSDVLNLVGHHFPPTIPLEGRRMILKAMNNTQDFSPVFNQKLYTLKESVTQRMKKKKFKDKQNKEDWMNEILKDLRPADLRVLMIAEDELNRSKMFGFKKIFPQMNMDKYNKYIESDPYYYQLLDAWEFAYGSSDERRKIGLTRLQEMASKKIHLKN